MAIKQRVNLKELEKEINKIVSSCLCKNENIVKKRRNFFVPEENSIFLSGPTFANNTPHLGTLFNLILKDCLTRLFWISGKNVCLLHGFDMHGEPIAKMVRKIYFNDEINIPKRELIEKCKLLAEENKNKMIAIFQEAGLAIHDIYHTRSPILMKKQLEILLNLYEKGYLQRKTMHVNLCAYCGTCLSLSEIEKRYCQNIDSLHFSFPTTCQRKLLIWTTTVYSVPYNQGLAFGDMKYVSFSWKNEEYISSEEFFLTLEDAVFQKEVTPEEIEKMEYINIFTGEINKIYFSDEVLREKGTGFLHLSSDLNIDDHNILINKGIQPRKNIFSQTKFSFQDEKLFITDFIQTIIDKLEKANHLFSWQKYANMKNICWRCKNPVIEILSEQWFIDYQQAEIYQQILDDINQTDMIPESETLITTFQKRKSWCISRQREWGVFIPSLKCLTCQIHFIDPKFTRNFIEQLEDETDWLEVDIQDVFCPKCQSKHLEKDEDILDVWLDSGLLPFTLPGNFANFLCEGVDQHRGWFQTIKILRPLLHSDRNYQILITHAFVVNNMREKISKSGQSENIQKILETLPIDVIRLCFLGQEIDSNIIFNQNILEATKKDYIYLRNNLFFLSKFSKKGKCENEFDINFLQFTQYFFQIEINRFQKKDENGYFKVNQFLNKIKYFINHHVNQYFLETSKKRLFHDQDPSSMHTCFVLLEILSTVLYPFLPYTSTELFLEHGFNFQSFEGTVNPFWEWFSSLKDINEAEEEINIKVPKVFHSTETICRIRDLFYKYKKKIVIHE